MKHRLVGTACVLAIMVMSLVTSAGSASASSFYGNANMCTTQRPHGKIWYCWNNWQGTLKAGKQVRIFEYGKQGEPNNDWDIWVVAKVSAKNNWPWKTPATQPLDVEYNGEDVYQFRWAPKGKGSGYCLEQTWDASINLGNGILGACVPTSKNPTNQYYVHTPGNNLMAVWATAVEYQEGNALKVAVTTNAAANGNYVYLEQLGNGDDQWYPIEKP
jgi:hypothetical protein